MAQDNPTKRPGKTLSDAVAAVSVADAASASAPTPATPPMPAAVDQVPAQAPLATPAPAADFANLPRATPPTKGVTPPPLPGQRAAGRAPASGPPGKAEASQSLAVPDPRGATAVRQPGVAAGQALPGKPANQITSNAPDVLGTGATEPGLSMGPAVSDPTRRIAKRRPAGPSRGQIAANDDVPSIGGLIYALEQKPAKKPYVVAAAMTGLWLAIGGFFAWGMLAPEIARSATFAELMTRPVMLTTLSTIVLPIAVFWFLAWMLYQAQDMRLRSSAMTEVAIRLAEPDRHAEQSVASLGQSVRKQVNFMNEAVSRAIGRAGELEAMVHNEVATLERSYTDNETRIRGLLGELASERTQLTTTSDQVHTTLRAMGDEVPALIEKLNSQQIKLAKIIEGAGQNLIALETSLVKASGQLETSLEERTTHLEGVLTNTTGQVQNLLVDRTNHLQTVLDEYTNALNASLGNRTGQLQTVFEDYTRALDATIAGRALALDTQLVDRTNALDAAFAHRLLAFDDSIRQSAQLIDGTVGEKAQALSSAMETHARQLADTLGRQASNLDETLMHGITAVRRTSENITRQSVKAIEGLSGQADMLKNVSENLLGQINTVTSRFDNQGQSIMRAANALETANYRIDQTLQGRHRELNETLNRLTGTSEQLGQQMLTYTSSLDSSIADAQVRAKAATEEMSRGAQSHAESALRDLERLKSETAQHTSRALDDMRSQMTSVSREVTQQVGSLSSRLNETSAEIKNRAETAASDFAREQERLRAEAARLPEAARESADAMRRVLAEQMRALEQLSALTNREAPGSDITPPASLPAPTPTPTLAAALAAQHIPAGQPPPRGQSAPPQATAAQAGWSLGDLLARASQDEAHGNAPSQAAAIPAPQANPINLDSIARALDPATASAIWARFRSGQRGIMVRSIYSSEGRGIFDEVTRRYQADIDFRGMVDRFLGDFELLLRDAESRDNSGRLLDTHLQSNSGRVYLFLAHASGRLV